MRHVLASAGIAILVATRAVAAQELTIDWSRTAVPGGVVRAGEGPGSAPALELRASGSGPTSWPARSGTRVWRGRATSRCGLCFQTASGSSVAPSPLEGRLQPCTGSRVGGGSSSPST